MARFDLTDFGWSVIQPLLPNRRKRPAIRAFQIRLTHEIVCPLIGKLSGTHDERYGAFRS